MISIVGEIRHPRAYLQFGDFLFGDKRVAKKLVMIRHGAVDERFANRFLGRTDVSLSATGQAQAAALALPLLRLKETRLMVSPLRRAQETALQALGGSDQAFETDAGLREMDFGQWETKTFAEVASVDPLAAERLNRFDAAFAFPGGETLAGFTKRVSDLAERIASDPARTVVTVTHGGIIRFLICHFLGLDARHYLLFDVGHASVTELALYGQKGVLTQLNDLCHLEAHAHG